MLVGIVTLKSAPWKLEDNFRRVEAYVREAAGRRAELVVAPESVLDGYVFNADPTSKVEDMLEIAQTVPDGAYIQRAGALCRELGIYLIFGFLERLADELFNACVMLDPHGEVIAHYRKITTAGEYAIAPGRDLQPFDTPLGRLGFLLCSDRTVDNCSVLGVQGAQVIFIPMDGSGGPENTEKMRWRARDNQCWIVIANTWSAVIISPSGESHLEKYETECVSVQYMHLPKVDKNQGRSRFVSRRADLYGPLVEPREPDAYYDEQGGLTPAGEKTWQRMRKRAQEKDEDDNN